MKNDKFLPYAVIVGVVAIVAIVSLFLWSGRTEGASVVRTYMTEEQEPCWDSDPGNDFYMAGIVKKSHFQYDDYCLSDKILYQHSCDSNYVKLSSPYECPNGCYRGKCIE